ncbi:MAG: hypothetical protein ABI758_01560 [Candidatus Woesebacteria bacterium]
MMNKDMEPKFMDQLKKVGKNALKVATGVALLASMSNPRDVEAGTNRNDIMPGANGDPSLDLIASAQDNSEVVAVSQAEQNADLYPGEIRVTGRGEATGDANFRSIPSTRANNPYGMIRSGTEFDIFGKDETPQGIWYHIRLKDTDAVEGFTEGWFFSGYTAVKGELVLVATEPAPTEADAITPVPAAPSEATGSGATTASGVETQSPVETPASYDIATPYPTLESVGASDVAFIAESNALGFDAIKKLKAQGVFTPVTDENVLVGTGLNVENKRLKAVIVGCTDNPIQLVPGYSADYCAAEFTDDQGRKWEAAFRLPSDDSAVILMINGVQKKGAHWSDAIQELRNSGRDQQVELGFNVNEGGVATRALYQALWDDITNDIASPEPFTPRSYGNDPRLAKYRDDPSMKQLDSKVSSFPQIDTVIIGS